MYLLFAGSTYYASGGAHDYQAAFPTRDDATAQGEALRNDDRCDWWHVFGLSEQAIVAQSPTQAYGVR